MVTIADLESQLAKLRKVSALKIVASADHNDLVDMVDLIVEYLKSL